MKYESISREIEKIQSIKPGYKDLLKNLKEQHGKKIIASPLLFLTPEINAAFDIVTLKIPEFLQDDTVYAEEIFKLYDAVIMPEKECCCSQLNSGIKPYIFRTPSGYGEDASVELHNEILKMLRSLFGTDIRSLNIEKLKAETSVYEDLRRLIRSIANLRAENISLLKNRDLSLVFETALILPPDIAVSYITPLLDEMKKIDGRNGNTGLRGMIYGGKSLPGDIADKIEDMGILIVEDDSCTGRRSFDISLNAGSDYIFYEILDSYSYRALTPCLRNVKERYELLYRLLKNYNIDAVIFYRDGRCPYSREDIDFLRIKMMRDGIDPLVIDDKNYVEIISDYVKAAGMQQGQVM